MSLSFEELCKIKVKINPFKVGDIVVCVHEKDSFPGLERGKEYTVLRILGHDVGVNGGGATYLCSRFEMVKKKRLPKIKVSKEIEI